MAQRSEGDRRRLSDQPMFARGDWQLNPGLKELGPVPIIHVRPPTALRECWDRAPLLGSVAGRPWPKLSCGKAPAMRTSDRGPGRTL